MVGWASLPLDSLVTLSIGPEVATCSLVKAVLLDTLPMEYPREDWAMLLLMEWSNVVEGEWGAPCLSNLDNNAGRTCHHLSLHHFPGCGWLGYFAP